MTNWMAKPRSKPMNVALHQTLGIPLDQKIPERTLRSIINTQIGSPVQVGYRGVVVVDTKMKYRANFALNAGQAQGGGF